MTDNVGKNNGCFSNCANQSDFSGHCRCGASVGFLAKEEKNVLFSWNCNAGRSGFERSFHPVDYGPFSDWTGAVHWRLSLEQASVSHLDTRSLG